MGKYADITPFYEWLDLLEKESNTPYPEYQTMMFYEIRDKLDTLQEVVRCKDCDWHREHEGGICVNPKCGKSWYGCPVPPEHFCSYGERKDNG